MPEAEKRGEDPPQRTVEDGTDGGDDHDGRDGGARTAFYNAALFCLARPPPKMTPEHPEHHRNKTMAEPILAMYDITISAEFGPPDKVREIFRTSAKRWAFQKERGEETGYEHYQCRISFAVKKRYSTAVNWYRETFGDGTGRLTPTSNPTTKTGNEFYVMKPETRIEGPWTDRDPVPMYIPKRLRGISLRPWQQGLLDMILEEPDDRYINVLIDPKGGLGKTTIKQYCMTLGHAVVIPPMVEEGKDVMGYILSKDPSRCYIMDLPKSQTNKAQRAMYGALETIKDGYAYDLRYHARDRLSEPPHVWVFTNRKPNTSLLSEDRWRYWEVRDGALTRTCGSVRPADSRFN